MDTRRLRSDASIPSTTDTLSGWFSGLGVVMKPPGFVIGIYAPMREAGLRVVGCFKKKVQKIPSHLA